MSGNNDRNNPKNPESELYKKLTKIFSGPIVNQRSQNTRKYRRDKLDKFAKVFKDTQGRKFQRAQNDRIFRDHSAQYLSTFERAQRYADFELMEFDPILASALDIYADEMTSHNQYQKILHIKSEKNEIRDILQSLFYNVLNVEYNLYSWARQLSKFGDFFIYLDVDERLGIKKAIVLPPAEIERVEGLDKDNPDYIQYKWSTGNVVFENFQVAHFKIDGNDKYAPLGTSVLESSRRVWRQLCISIGEKVLTVRGQKNIENILVGDEVYSWSVEKNILEPTKVVAKKWMGKKDVYEIRTNHRALKTTDNHLFLINDGNGIFYKEAQQIKVGKDNLFLPVNKKGKETYTTKTNPDNYCVKLKNPAEYSSEGIVKKLKEIETNVGYRIIHQFLRAKKRISYSDFQIISKHFNFDEENVCYFYKHSEKEALVNKDFEFTIDSDFVKLFGFLLGDGWVKDNRVGFALGVYEEENKFYKELLEKYSKSKANVQELIIGQKSGGQVNVFCKELQEIFETLGFHTGAFFKDVPSWVFEMSRDIRREFVLGYFDADGGDKDGRLTSISKELLYGVQNVCYSCGIPCNKIIQDRKETFDKNGMHRYISYRMYINKNTKSWCNSDYSLEKVIGYKFVKSDEDVYDIQVESENHNFIANGVVVHNCLMEDAMMAYRVVRATERKVYYIDIGGIPPEDIEQHMLGIMQSTKKNQIVDPQSGRVDLRYNALSLEDDIYIPVRGTEQGTRIESLPGGDMVGAIDDIKYMKDKLFAAIKIPQSYLIRGEGGEEEKGTLAQKDIRFARTIQRLQRSLVAELDKIAKIHLYTLGYRNADLVSFEILLNNPSKLAEQQELEHWKTKFDVAAGAIEACVSERWIAKNLLNLSDEEFLRNRQEILHDVAFAQLKALAEKGGIDGAASTGGGGSALSDFGPGPEEGGEMPTGADGNEGGGFDLPFSPGDTAAGSIPGEGGEESDSMLLATPGNDSSLQEQGHLTPGSKGHVYHPVKDDQRDDGARTRSFRQAASSRQARMTKGQVNIRLQEIMNKVKSKAIYEEDSFVNGLNEETKAILENLKKTGVNKK